MDSDLTLKHLNESIETFNSEFDRSLGEFTTSLRCESENLDDIDWTDHLSQYSETDWEFLNLALLNRSVSSQQFSTSAKRGVPLEFQTS